jgi:hypothetical protein
MQSISVPEKKLLKSEIPFFAILTLSTNCAGIGQKGQVHKWVKLYELLLA